MLSAIELAASSVHFVTFVYWQGEIASQFADALASAAARGVQVRVVLDSLGANSMERALVARMERSGVEVAWFRPVRLLHLGKATHRTHRKVLICDGRTAFSGGVGIASEWTGDAEDEGSWRETHFQLSGPVVAGLQAAFLGNWMSAKPGAKAELLDVGCYLENAGNHSVQVVRSTASIDSSDIATAFRAGLVAATKRVRIATPYFTPDASSMTDLLDLLGRGVELQLLVPGPTTDSRMSRIAARDHFEPLLEAGASVMVFQPTMLHAKVMTIDGLVSIVGSANFNHRSMRKDDELVLNVVSEALTTQLDGHFDDDLVRAEEVELSQWRERSAWQRLLEWSTRPFHGEM